MSGESAEGLSAAPAAVAPRAHYAGARAIVAAAIGNALEWYDFSVYAFFAIYLAQIVFVGGNTAMGLIRAFLVFAVGFIARPLGAILLGAYADRAGRRAALTLTLIIMAAGTFLIAVVPPYAAVGLLAPILVLCGRLLQGLSAGGEIGGAVSFLVEHAPPERRGRYASWLQASMAVSNILGALVAAGLQLLLTEPQLAAWGWRVPFILGLGIAPVGLWLRARLDETPAFEAARREPGVARRSQLAPVTEILKEEPRALLAAAGISIVWVVAVYTLVIYLPTYMQRILKFSASSAFIASVIANIVMAFACIAAGRLSDRFGRVRVLRLGAALILITVLPLLAWVSSVRTVPVLILTQTCFCLVVAIFAGSAPAVVAGLFPTRLRSTGVSLSYNFAATVFGGSAPAILTYFTEQAQDVLAPALYVMAAAVVSLGVLLTVRARESAA